MASADLRKELDCSVCLSLYSDPVMLRCGHNFCRGCIAGVLEAQGVTAGGYSCPECREEFRERPTLYMNITLRNIMENLRGGEPGPAEVLCSHCVDSPVVAVRTCLHCEASLCDKHLRVHSKTSEHVLCDPTASLEGRKCPLHRKLLEYYCPLDATCICLACRLDGAHRGHRLETLAEASEERKKKLRDTLPRLTAARRDMKARVRGLQECRRDAQQKAEGETERVTARLRDLKRQLEELEKRVLGDMARRAERAAMAYDEEIRRLEVKMEELARKMRHIEELCNMADPLTVLRGPASGDLCDIEEGDLCDIEEGDLCDTEEKDLCDIEEGVNEDRERHDEDPHDMDMAAISHTLHVGLSEILAGVPGSLPTEDPTDFMLDVETASSLLRISDDGRTATKRPTPYKNLPETPKRFQDYPQVMSSWRVSSGQHFWEVDVEGAEYWRVGMCYPSMDRTGEGALLGDNDKSWCLRTNGIYYYMRHNKDSTTGYNKLCNKFRVYLDYEAGRISFYFLRNPIRHIHTYTATFTEPLHIALYIPEDYHQVTISGGNPEV